MIPPSGYLNLKFYQNTGTGKVIVGNPNVSLIGQISIDTAGKPGCDVTFAVGANRTLRVFANGSPRDDRAGTPARGRELDGMTVQVNPQLVIDLGGRVLSALLVTADGELVPCSQEIRQVATRHVSADILFEPRVVEDRDFLWDDALESFEKSGAHNFFPRAKRVGLRRPWDPQASVEALQLASPLTVLSSPEALADRTVRTILPRVASAMLEALLEPTFTFVEERQLAAGNVDPVVVLPAQIGRHARLVLRSLFRRRGFRRLTIVSRELAAAMTLGEQAPFACVVFETSETDLHVHRVVVAEGEEGERRFRTAASATLPGLGWNYWSVQIAEALRMTPGAALRTVAHRAAQRVSRCLAVASEPRRPGSRPQ